MIRCTHKDNLQDALIVRVYLRDNDLLNRDSEVMGLQVAHAAGCGTPLIAIFKNGIVVGCFDGRTAVYADYFNPSIMRWDIFR